MQVQVASASSSSDESVQVQPMPKKAVRTKKTTTTPKPPRVKATKNRPDRFETGEMVAESSPSILLPSSRSPEVKKERIETVPILPPPPPSLNQETYPSFFSLVREILLNSDNPTTCKQLVDCVVVWTNSPISPLNEW